MIVVAIVAILAAIALPSYRSYIQKSQARAAAADLVALGLVMEQRYQKTLKYPAYANETVIAADVASRADSLQTDFGAWSPAQGKQFAYSVVESTASTYKLKATTKQGQTFSCTLLIDEKAKRDRSGCAVLTDW